MIGCLALYILDFVQKEINVKGCWLFDFDLFQVDDSG